MPHLSFGALKSGGRLNDKGPKGSTEKKGACKIWHNDHPTISSRVNCQRPLSIQPKMPLTRIPTLLFYSRAHPTTST